MASNEKTLEYLLELCNPAIRRTRAELIDRALHTALMLMDADAVAIMTPASRRGERLVLHAGSPAPAVLPAPPQGSEVVRSLGETCQQLVYPDLLDVPPVAAGDSCPGVQAGPALFTPLLQRDPAPGYVGVYRGRGRARFTTSDCRQMFLLTAWLSTSLENLRLSTGHERLAVTDDITEVYNARFLKVALRRETRRASRYRQELSIVMIDVDNLKAYNEEHGELRGSLLLKEMASLLSQQVRSFDLMARFGDVEFLVILPQTDRAGGVEVAERMRSAVERHAFPLAEAGATTVSIGVATFPNEGEDANALISTAGRALRLAQERGMNCVETLERAA